MLGLLLAAWEVLARYGVIDPFYLPPPSRVGGALAALFISGDIWTHIAATFGAALLGLLIGSLIGMALAMLAAASRATFLLLEPFMTAMNAVPRSESGLIPSIQWSGNFVRSDANLRYRSVEEDDRRYFSLLCEVAGLADRLG